MKTLSFYTTGAEMTSLVYNILNDGNFKSFFAIMDDSGIEDVYVQLFLKGCIELEGDTRKDGLFLTTPENPHEVDMQTAIITWLKSSDEYKEQGYVDFDPIYSGDWKPEHERLKALLGDDYIPKIFKERQSHLFPIIGYEVLYSIPERKNTINGIVIQDGTFIHCSAYGHRNLEKQLIEMGYDSEKFLNISYNEVYGALINYFYRDIDEVDYNCLIAQFKTLKKFPVIRDKYSDNSIYYLLNRYFVEKFNNGGKYGNLKFISEFYGFKIPKISTEYFEGAGFVRSSPKYSMPGILESYPIQNESEVEDVISKMKKEFEKNSELVKFNSFHYFFQEFIEGKTGVAHYFNDGEFSYSMSKSNYDIVEGKTGTEKLTLLQKKELKLMLKEISIDFAFDYDIQVEFCINSDGEIVILQFRTFEVENNDIEAPEMKGEIVCEGISFSSGVAENLYGKEILVVENDATPSQLIGKKALIVTGDGQYSHILSLARTLNIPAIYQTGDVELQELSTYSIVSTKKESKIFKL